MIKTTQKNLRDLSVPNYSKYSPIFQNLNSNLNYMCLLFTCVTCIILSVPTLSISLIRIIQFIFDFSVSK